MNLQFASVLMFTGLLAAAAPPEEGKIEYLGVAVAARVENSGIESVLWIKRAKFNSLREQAGLTVEDDGVGMKLKIISGALAWGCGMPPIALVDLEVLDDDVAGDESEFVSNDCFLVALSGEGPPPSS